MIAIKKVKNGGEEEEEEEEPLLQRKPQILFKIFYM